MRAGGGAGADDEDCEGLATLPELQRSRGERRREICFGARARRGHGSGTLYHTNAENQLEPSLIRLSVHEATFVSITSPNSPAANAHCMQSLNSIVE